MRMPVRLPSAPNPPGTVCHGGDPDRPLPDAAEVAGTLAVAAIKAGLGAYLESIGYVREHPQLYVNESGDPYVYVRFDISEDGLGFLDTTYVYSPSVSAKLDEIFTAYDVYGPDEDRRPYTSTRSMLGRPVHASLQSLGVAYYEEYEGEDNQYRELQMRPRPRLKRMAARMRACRWARKHGREFKALRFGRAEHWSEFARLPPIFATLPLNWDHKTTNLEARVSNWLAAGDIAATAQASYAVWRRYAEPFLIHTAMEGGEEICVPSHFGSGLDNEGGYGQIDQQWYVHDYYFWLMKGQSVGKYYGDAKDISFSGDDVGECVLDEFEHLYSPVWQVIDDQIKSNPILRTIINKSNSTEILDKLLKIPAVSNAANRYDKSSAIAAFRNHYIPVKTWRKSNKKSTLNIEDEKEEVILKWINVLG